MMRDKIAEVMEKYKRRKQDMTRNLIIGGIISFIVGSLTVWWLIYCLSK